MLEVKELTVCYDTAMLLNEVSMEAHRGELVSIIGPNGAGKTTLMRAISGLVLWEKQMKRGTRAGNITITGEVYFQGRRIEELPPHRIARMGLVLCPERRRPFSELTVGENLRAGAYLLHDHRRYGETLELIYRIFPVLQERSRQISATLSGGEQQMLAIGRALMTQPLLLCIDEPSTGLSPLIKQELFARIREINESGITMLLVEQDVNLTLEMSSRSYILSHSKIVARGARDELMADETIRQSYLGL